MLNLIFLFSSILLSVISAPSFQRLDCKLDSHYFVPKFQKWTTYPHFSIPHIAIFWGFRKHSYVPHIFYHNHFLCLRWLNRMYCCNFGYLVKEEQYQFYYMKIHFCAWLLSIGKYHFARKSHWLRHGKVPVLSKGVTEYAYHRSVDHTWL